MKNLFLFIVIAAGVVMAWLLYKKKKPTGANPQGEVPNQKITKVIEGHPFLTNFDPTANIDWSEFTTMLNDMKQGKNCDTMPDQYKKECIKNAISPNDAIIGVKNDAIIGVKPVVAHLVDIQKFTGNGALELFTGNSALEYFTGLPGTIIPAKKPTCFSIWQHNISNPNGPAFPMWPGLNCRNSAI